MRSKASRRGLDPQYTDRKLDQIAASYEWLRLGSDVNAKGDLGHTPLHYAAMAGHRSATIALLSAGASNELRNEWGQIPSETADVGGHHEVACSIREHQKWKSRFPPMADLPTIH
jgi:ankyrin repeat protein